MVQKSFASNWDTQVVKSRVKEKAAATTLARSLFMNAELYLQRLNRALAIKVVLGEDTQPQPKSRN